MTGNTVLVVLVNEGRAGPTGQKSARSVAGQAIPLARYASPELFCYSEQVQW